MNQATDLDPVGRDAKDRILDVAEKLFADNGFAATSLRQITAEAAVNLAAVNYYFRSKDELAKAVLMRKMVPLNEERLRRLDLLEASSQGIVPLDGVLDCFIRPVFEARRRRELRHFPRFMGRIFMEPGEWVGRVVEPVLTPMLARFTPAFRLALPGAKPEAVVWGMFFGIGSFVHTLANGYALPMLSAGVELGEPGEDEIADRMIRFVAAGMRGLPRSHTQGGTSA